MCPGRRVRESFVDAPPPAIVVGVTVLPYDDQVVEIEVAVAAPPVCRALPA